MKAIIYHYGYKSMSLEYRFLKDELYDGRQFTSTNILFNILFICFVKQIDRCDDHSSTNDRISNDENAIIRYIFIK